MWLDYVDAVLGGGAAAFGFTSPPPLRVNATCVTGCAVSKYVILSGACVLSELRRNLEQLAFLFVSEQAAESVFLLLLFSHQLWGCVG